MIRRPPRSRRTDTLCHCTTLFRSDVDPEQRAAVVAQVGGRERDSGRERLGGGDLGELPHGLGGGCAGEHRPPELLLVAQGLLQSSEEHTSELQSLMRISYAVFVLKKITQTLLHYDFTLQQHM